MPLVLANEDTHIIDRPVNLIETSVQEYDRGHWVEDLYVLGALNTGVLRMTCDHGECSQNELLNAPNSMSLESCPQLKATLIDSWVELLDPPKSGTVITRSHGNWLARLGFAVMCRQTRLYYNSFAKSRLLDLLYKEHKYTAFSGSF